MNGVTQSSFGKLTGRLFLLAFKRNLALCIALFALTMILMMASVNNFSFIFAYESLIMRAGIRYVFLAGIAFCMILEAAGIYAEAFKSGGVYTLMMLPMPRRNVFLAYCARGAVCMLMLFTVQTLALLASYPPVVALCRNAAEVYSQASGTALPFAAERTNGLFLAVIRSDLFHILLPQSIPEAINSLLALLAAGFLPAYTLAGGFRIRAAQIVFLVSSVVCVFWALGCRFDSVTMGVDVTAFVISTALMAFFAAGAVVGGVRRLNKDASLV